MLEESPPDDALEYLRRKAEQCLIDFAEEFAKENMKRIQNVPNNPLKTADAGLSEAEIDELEIEDMLANMMTPIKIPDSNQDSPSVFCNRLEFCNEFYRHRRALQLADIMSQDEIELLLEGVRLGQKMQCQAGMK